MMKINQGQNPMMMNLNKDSENINKENNLVLHFKISGEQGRDIPPFIVKCTENEKVSDIVEKYRNLSGDKDKKKKFIFNAKALDLSKTVYDSGITNNSYIFVVSVRVPNCY